MRLPFRYYNLLPLKSDVCIGYVIVCGPNQQMAMSRSVSAYARQTHSHE